MNNGKSKTPTTAILYTRFSPRPNAEECESIEFQLDRLRPWCQALGLEIIGEHSDEDLSGKEADNRPGLQAAIAQACKTRATVCVYSLSRLSRNVADSFLILSRLRRHKAGLASVTEVFSTNTAFGRAMFGMLAIWAALEREQTVERTSDAMRSYQRAGRRMGRPDRVPFGWRVCLDDPASIEGDPGEMITIVRIRELAAAGESYRGICRQLDREGIRRRGKGWEGAHRLVATILERS